MTQDRSRSSSSRLAGLSRVAVGITALAASLAWPVGPAPAAAEGTAAGLVEVDRLPLVTDGPGGDSLPPDTTGWLILDTRNRFAYQVFESGGGPKGEGQTVVQSFDLDTLEPRRRAVLNGVVITTGPADVAGAGGTAVGGEIVHAVDEERGRLYLAMSVFNVAIFPRMAAASTGATDGQRPLTRLVMIDEAAFDRGDAAFAASFREPAPRHSALHYYNLLNLAVPSPGRLLGTFAHPGIVGDANAVFAHTLARWDTESLAGRVAPGEELRGEADSLPLLDPAADEKVLDVCARSSMAAAAGIGEGQLQWGTLVMPGAYYLACQASQGSGTVVEVALGPGGGLATSTLRTFPLAKPVVDVLVDPPTPDGKGGGRLLLRTAEIGGSAGNAGSTMWVFDARKGRYVGAVAIKQGVGPKNSMGLDPATGRLYTLMPDHTSTDARGTAPVRGGFQVSDTRLDPAPPLDNVAPELAYPGIYRIVVDPPTRRVFVRRGHGAWSVRMVYPGTGADTPAPPERFYRVYRDDIPLRAQPAEVDDSAFTTEVAEGPLTTASYLGSGSGYGARTLLVGGLDPLTSGAASRASPLCGRDDRELVAGSVGRVELSDLSAAAAVAALEGDPRLAAASPDLVDACGPTGGAAPGTEVLAFDEETGKDADGDGKIDRTGENHYAATCLGDEGVRGARGFRADRPHDDGFEARAECRRARERAEGGATGAVGAPTAVAAASQVTVGRATSTVTVTRKRGEGVRVVVDSVARDVEIAGVGSIAVVRTEVTATATGRRGRAGATFERSICGVVVTGRMDQPGCLAPGRQGTAVEAINAALGARGRARLREPEPTLAEGSPSGYRAAVQRKAEDLFEDRLVTRDVSAAVPGLELMFFQGDGDPSWGTGRQIVQLAGAQASTSYGIACLYGEKADGGCAREGEAFVPAEPPAPTTGAGGGTRVLPGERVLTTVTETLPGESALPLVGRDGESLLTRVLRAPVRALAQALGLLFNNPRELALLATVWLLLYAPFHLGERHRNVRRLRTRPSAVAPVR